MSELGEFGGVDTLPEPKIGDGRRSDLPDEMKPVASAFGEFNSLTTYDIGCKPVEVIQGNGVVMFESSDKDETITRQVTIGRTPEDIDLEDETMKGAGEKGHYLMHIRKVYKDKSDPYKPAQMKEEFKFLDSVELVGREVKKGDNMTQFNVNPVRKQALNIPGIVRNVYALN